MIISKQALSMAQAKVAYNPEEENEAVKEYFKAYSKTSKDKSEKIVEAVKALNNPKMKDEEIVKVADFLPLDVAEVNKIFVETGLTEEEANAVVEIVKGN
jgi:DNA-directed RNA polymerase subunit F